MIYILFYLGQFLTNHLVQWWTNRQNALLTPPSPPPLVYVDDTIWPETPNNNWHEDPEVYVWHAAPANEWEAAALPPGWGDFTPPSNRLTPRQQQQAKYHQIENLKP
jgi:hypothetical protein